MQFLDFSVVVHLFVVVFDEDALLDEAVDEVDHHGIGLREQGKDFEQNGLACSKGVGR